MTYPICYLDDVEKIIRKIKEKSDVPVVVGGSGASLMPESVLDRLGADYIIVSHGEKPFVELLHAIENRSSPDSISGVGYLKRDTFHLNRPQVCEFLDTGSMLGRWIDMEPYLRVGSSFCIQSRRGCRHRCIYCTYNQLLEGSMIRNRPPDEVVDELEEAHLKYGIGHFEFVDSVFNDPLDHCLEVLEEIIRRPWYADFTAMGVSPKGVDDTLLELMKKAGFNSFWMSPESASPSVIRRYGKGFTYEDLVHAAEAVSRSDFNVIWCFLIGGPGETNKTLQESLDFVMKYLTRDTHPPMNLANFYFGIRVYPGTILWDIALTEGHFPNNIDPLQQLWYLSHDLDLDQGMEQFFNAMYATPEISSGYHEKYMRWSKPAARIINLLRLPKPYWANGVLANKLFYKLRLHHIFPLPNPANHIRNQLKRQGYVGPHLG